MYSPWVLSRMALSSVAAWLEVLCSFASLCARQGALHETGSTNGVWCLQSGRVASSMVRLQEQLPRFQIDGY